MVQDIYVPILNYNTGEKETDESKLITPNILSSINSFLDLKKENFIEELQDEIFRLFNISIEATSYGQVPDELIEEHGNTEANRIFFEGNNKETVYNNCKFNIVSYNNENPEKCFTIFTEIDWDLEHGLIIHFADGKFIEIE
ncbi:DUF6985 domain-containing protein [Tenacibaculum litoreum]